MFRKSSKLLLCFLVAFLSPLSSIDPPKSSIPSVHLRFPAGFFIPVVAQLRSNKRITDLMKKVQEAQKKDPESKKSPLDDKEMKEVQSLIEGIYKNVLKDITALLQKISNEQKFVIHVEVETDMQIIPGVPFSIDLMVAPENLSADEKLFIASYKKVISSAQKGIQELAQGLFKKISDSAPSVNPEAKK